MKVGLLAGGLGTRLAEETVIRPKPMVEIGGKPILWHIMNHYASFGMNEFVVALGYKGEYVKRWFVDYASLESDLRVHTGTGEVIAHSHTPKDWSVELIDTGQSTNTGGRIKRLAPFMNGETFMLTWGDGVANVDLDALLAFHRAHGRIATLTAVRPPARYGHLELDGDRVTEFSEKPQAREGWINGAFFVLEPEVFDYIDGDATQFELEPMMQLAAQDQLRAYKHHDFWACMDTMRDKVMLERLWESDKAPWKVD